LLAEKSPASVHSSSIKGRASFGYRGDIDGIRAIAVILVLLFHGGNQFFSSGFIGVDIFFVISGYLISSILLKDAEAGQLSIKKFYERRLWRLQPAMLVLLVATTVVAFAIYLPHDFVDFLKSSKYASMFLANQHFAKETTAYAADDSASLLLLHTWSLAIEWQWYLLMPACFVVLRRLFSPKRFKLAIGILTVLSTAGALYLGSAEPSKSYYFFSSRIFELFIGACVAVLFSNYRPLHSGVSSVVGLGAIAVIVYCSTRVGILSGFPNFYALAVSIATAALLIPAVGQSGVHGAILGSLVPKFIGKISYSLYLWHWPILATLVYLGVRSSPLSSGIYYIGATVAAIASYGLVERVFRYRKMSVYVSFAILVLLPAVLFSVLYKTAVKHDGWPERFGSAYAKGQQQIKAYESEDRHECIDGDNNGSDPRCTVGDRSASRHGLLIGDSFSNQYWGFVDVLAKDAGISVTALSTSACLTLPDVYLWDWWKFKNVVYQKCHDNVSYYDMIKKNHYTYVMLGQIWENYENGGVLTAPGDENTTELSRDRVAASMRRALKVIVDSGATPVILKATHTMPDGVNECLTQPLKTRGLLGDKATADACSTTPVGSDGKSWFDALFVTLKDEFPTLVVIDPKQIQCDQTNCKTVVNGVPVYRDVGHITDFASFTFGAEYLKRFGNPLK
jgi:peptidoglycan/LPS O-acetylase OafA/YrhL